MRGLTLLALSGCIRELPELADPCAEIPSPGLYNFTVDGRKAQIEVPDTLGPRPAIVMLHGAQQSGATIREVSRFDVIGDAAGVVTVYPNGTGRGLGVGRTWNAEGCCPPAVQREIDDVAWLDAVSAALEDRVCVDRTYAAGFSNGAMMALRWGCDGDGVDGVIAAAGTLHGGPCDGEGVPTLLAHGRQDPVVPYDGGTFNNDGVHPSPGSDETLAVLLERNRCDPEPVLDDRGGGVVCEVFACAVPVERCTLDAWGHRWPGGIHAAAAGYDLTQESVEFLLRPE